MGNKIKYRLKKQLAMLHCRFILGVIGHSERLSPEIDPDLIDAVEDKLGPVEEVLPAQDFPDAPESYIREMGSKKTPVNYNDYS